MYPIDDEWSARMDAEVARGHMGAKLAFVRLGFNYFVSETVFRYVVEAVHLLADEGWRLLPLYRFDPESGLWSHANGRTAASLELRHLAFEPTAPATAPRKRAPESVLPGQLEAARRLLGELGTAPPAHAAEPPLTSEFERARWFVLPSEVVRRPRRATRLRRSFRSFRPRAEGVS
jgi:hypothetical protein